MPVALPDGVPPGESFAVLALDGRALAVGDAHGTRRGDRLTAASGPAEPPRASPAARRAPKLAGTERAGQ